MKRPDNLIVNKSFEFAVQIIEFCELLESKGKYIIARQLLKAGTSIGANVRESQNAESRADFIHKLKIALKESEETDYWLLLCETSKTYPNPEGLIDANDELWKIMTKIVSTSRNSK